MGGITRWLYDDMALGGVMTLAMMLNLLMAALMGVIIPMTMVKSGDPAVGSSVMITAITDTGGFFIFLGLATLFLDVVARLRLTIRGRMSIVITPATTPIAGLPVETVAATVTSITSVSVTGSFVSVAGWMLCQLKVLPPQYHNTRQHRHGYFCHHFA